MIIRDWKNMRASIYYFCKLIFITRKYDVVFVSSVFFNRGEGGQNLLFKPMIEFCESNGLNYTIFEDTDLKGAYNKFKRNNKAVPFDFISLVQIMLKKIYNFKYKKPITKEEIYLRESKVSECLRKLFFKKFHSKIYITLIWNNVTLWRTIDSSACIVDYQHGIISDGDEAHIKDGYPPLIKSINGIVTLVYGNTFKDILIDNDKSRFYSERNVINTGIYKNNIKSMNKIKKNNKKILFTLQITPDFEEKTINALYIEIVEELMNVNAEFLRKNNYEIIFRHHPRYNTINCQDIILGYDFVSFDIQTPMVELLNTVALHITFHSTSVFEAAMVGVPTIFIDMHKNFSPNEIFLKQYKYPCRNLVIRHYDQFESILFALEEQQVYSNYCNDVYKWSQELYHDFDSSIFGNFLLNELKKSNLNKEIINHE